MSYLFGMMFALAPPGAVPVVGGSSDPSVPRSPGVSPQKVQGGPWAPPPCCDNSPETLFAWCLFFLLGVSWVFVWFLVWVSWPSGLRCCFGLVPFKTCPLFALMFVSPLSFFFCLVCSPTTFFFLSFSLSGAGETQAPFGVWVSPCVFFLLDADFVYNPHSELSTYT